MTVKTIHALHGPTGTTPPGEVVEIEDAEAQRLAAIGAVELLAPPASKGRPDAKSAAKPTKGN